MISHGCRIVHHPFFDRGREVESTRSLILALVSPLTPLQEPITCKLRAVGESTRRIQSLTDVDVALDSIEATTLRFLDKEVSKTARKAMKDFYFEIEASGLETIEMVEEHRVIQQALRKAHSRKRQLRKHLLQMQRVKTELQSKLAAAKSDLESQDKSRKVNTPCRVWTPPRFPVPFQSIRTQARTLTPAYTCARLTFA